MIAQDSDILIDDTPIDGRTLPEWSDLDTCVYIVDALQSSLQDPDWRWMLPIEYVAEMLE